MLGNLMYRILALSRNGSRTQIVVLPALEQPC